MNLHGSSGCLEHASRDLSETVLVDEACGGTARGCRGRVRTFLSSLIDLLAEVFYLTGEDGEEFPVVVEFDRHVDGFGLQFEPAGGSPEGDVAALRVD